MIYGQYVQFYYRVSELNIGTNNMKKTNCFYVGHLVGKNILATTDTLLYVDLIYRYRKATRWKNMYLVGFGYKSSLRCLRSLP